MKRFVRGGILGILATLCLLAAGCFERTQKITLNPDGSGKTEFDLVMSPDMDLNMGGPDKPKPSVQEQLKAAVTGMIQKSVGIDAWKDVSYEATKEGRFHVRGVAYFKDFNTLKFQMGNMSSDSKESWTKDPQGGMVLELMKEEEKPGEAADAAPAMTDAEIDQKLAEAKVQWQQVKPMAAAMLTTLKEDATYMLPGKVTDAGALQEVRGGVRMVLEGKKVLDAMDKLMSDDAALKESIKSGRDPLKDKPDSAKFNEMFFGKPGKPVVKVGGDLKPLFDYNAEVAAAKAAMPEMMKKLGLSDQAATE